MLPDQNQTRTDYKKIQQEQRDQISLSMFGSIRNPDRPELMTVVNYLKGVLKQLESSAP